LESGRARDGETTNQPISDDQRVVRRLDHCSRNECPEVERDYATKAPLPDDPDEITVVRPRIETQA
jgi:hypothetical protein